MSFTFSTQPESFNFQNVKTYVETKLCYFWKTFIPWKILNSQISIVPLKNWFFCLSSKYAQIYFIFKPEWLKFGKNGCLTGQNQQRFHRSHTSLCVKLISQQNDKTIYDDIYLKTQLWMRGTRLSLRLKIRYSINLICLFLNL